MSDQLHLVLQPVLAARAAEFEDFISDVVNVAVRAERPDLVGRWRVMRASEASDGVVTFAFLLEGGSLTEDWDLGVLLPAHYGEEEADRLFDLWAETFAPLAPWAAAAVATADASTQLAWTLESTSSD